jgi:hypothetical protein
MGNSIRPTTVRRHLQPPRSARHLALEPLEPRTVLSAIHPIALAEFGGNLSAPRSTCEPAAISVALPAADVERDAGLDQSRAFSPPERGMLGPTMPPAIVPLRREPMLNDLAATRVVVAALGSSQDTWGGGITRTLTPGDATPTAGFVDRLVSEPSARSKNLAPAAGVVTVESNFVHISVAFVLQISVVWASPGPKEPAPHALQDSVFWQFDPLQRGSLEVRRPDPAAAASLHSGSPGSMSASSSRDSGSMALTVEESLQTAHWYAYGEDSSALLVVDAKAVMAGVESWFEASRPRTFWGSAELGSEVDHMEWLARRTLPGSVSGTEGGLVDLDATDELLLFSSSLASLNSHAARTRTLRTTNAGPVLEPGWADAHRAGPGADELVLLSASRLRAIRHRSPGEDAGDDAQASNQRSRDAEEGGLIELATAWFSASDAEEAVRSSGNKLSPSAIGTGGIRMDAGLGLFQAIEVATGPAAQVGPSAAAPGEALPAGAATSSVDTEAAEDQAAATTPSVSQALIVSAFLAVATQRTDAARKEGVGCSEIHFSRPYDRTKGKRVAREK